jgi:hypothetical protein
MREGVFTLKMRQITPVTWQPYSGPAGPRASNGTPQGESVRQPRRHTRIHDPPKQIPRIDPVAKDRDFQD